MGKVLRVFLKLIKKDLRGVAKVLMSFIEALSLTGVLIAPIIAAGLLSVLLKNLWILIVGIPCNMIYAWLLVRLAEAREKVKHGEVEE